jgi:hypothetical protein
VFFLSGGTVALFNLAPSEAKGVFDVIEGKRIERVTLLYKILALFFLIFPSARHLSLSFAF